MLFQGQIGSSFNEEIKTRFAYLSYYKDLHYDVLNEIKFYFNVTSGQDITEGDSYYISNLTLPVKLGEYRIVPRFGYINSSSRIEPCYNLSSYVTGYENEKGNRLVSLFLERQFQIYPYSDNPFLALMNGSVFVRTGDVISADESVKDFKLHTSGGLGLVWAMGQVEYRLEEFVTDKGEWQTMFFVSFSY